MCSSDSEKVRRTAAGVMGIMMLVIVLLSALCIAAEADHDCTGEDCLICACIGQCENILRGIGDGTAAQLSAVIPVLLILFFAALLVAEFSQETLIAKKVRLNN